MAVIPPVNAKVAAQIGGMPTCRIWRIVRTWATPEPAERAPPRMPTDLRRLFSPVSMLLLSVVTLPKSWVDCAVAFAVCEHVAGGSELVA